QMDTKTLAYSDQFADQLGRHTATVTGLFLLREQVHHQRQRDARARFMAQFLRDQSSLPSIIGKDIDPGSFDLEHQYFIVILSLDSIPKHRIFTIEFGRLLRKFTGSLPLFPCIHRNTLRNRLNRIRRLLGTSLTAEVAYHLRLAWDWQQLHSPRLSTQQSPR
ncbi:MAG: hypothetical protein C7B47_16400, partial [Sulfobacillus thermosulfidooxidans]